MSDPVAMARRNLPPLGFWSLPHERTIHQLLAEIERLQRELKEARELYEANHG